MNPDNPDLKRLHYSAPDTAVLYDLLHRWIYVYGRVEAVRSILDNISEECSDQSKGGV
jgi:hypothetical protein